jgi:DNA polymerase IV (DinB-like DNA polymerase)
MGARGAGFYPPSLEAKEHLSYYSRVFDFVEVGLPATYRFSLKRWATDTPEDFRFAVRIPRQAAEGGALGTFLEGLAPVDEKVLAVVIQTPPAPGAEKGQEWLDDVLASCTCHGYSAVVEFSHPSWLGDLSLGTLKKHGASVCWSTTGMQKASPAIVTSDLVYLRLAGSDNWRAWVQKARDEAAADDRRVEAAVAIVADSPALATAALRAMGLPEKKRAGPLLPSPAPLVPKSRWSGRAVACVDLNAFYPSCEELREPSLRGKPHAVIMTDQPAGAITRGVVSSCSYEARRFGTRSAMPLSRALALCPGLVLRPVDIPYYKQVSEKVMEVVAGFANVLEQASIDEAFLDCTAKMGDANPEEYAAKIKGAIRERCGLAASVGIAPNKSAAKVACDFIKPGGVTVVYPDRLQDFLAPLEVGRISGIGPKTQEELKRIGVETIGQLAAYDVQKLSSRFGRNGVWMWQVATGAESEPVTPRDDYVSISTEHSLELYAKTQEEVVAHINDLVDELYDRVARRGYTFRTVGVKLVRSDFTVESREMSFASAKSGREAIALAIPQLAGRFSYDAPVRKVGLRVTNLSARKEAQRTLFDFAGG